MVVPVNLRPYQEEIQLGNEFAVIFLKLPLDIPDPVTRLAAVRARMERVKTSPEAVANRTLIRLVGHLPDRLERWIIRLFGTKATAVLTNVPGPEETRCIWRALRSHAGWPGCRRSPGSAWDFAH